MPSLCSIASAGLAGAAPAGGSFLGQPTWIWAAALVLVLVAAEVGLRLRRRQLRAAQDELRRQVAERTRELARERDIVARQAERLAELDRLKSELFANVSHEFRTPLTLTLGPLRDLQAGVHGELSAEVARQVDLARRNSERLLRLVEQLLDTARVDAGRLEIRVRHCDLVALLADLAERFAPLAERRGVRFRYLPAVGTLSLWCDPDQLEKVFANLLSNAMRYTPPDGQVELRLEQPQPGRLVAVTVRDDGPGIAWEEQELIFDRFYRVERALSFSDGGTGLGLPLARELAELHGGRLTLESEPGEGSLFRVELRLGRDHFTETQIVEDDGGEPGRTQPAPAVAAALLDDRPSPATDRGPAPALPPPPILDDDRTTVLVVDDNADVRAYVRHGLEQRYRVLEAADGAEGLARAREHLPDLVVSDVLMPGMDGHALCRALKEDPELEYVPVIMLTAKASSDSKLAGLKEGADSYLTKPFDARELVARVDNLIALRRRLRERFSAGEPPPVALPLTPGARPSSDDLDFLARVRAAMRSGLAEESFGVGALAGGLAMDRSQLYRRLHGLTGSSPSALLLEARLTQAAKLLDRATDGVGEVAAAVGFKSVAHFSQCFRSRFGLTPSAYRSRGEPPA